MVIQDKYKRTELGKIPEDWVNCTWGEMLTGFSSGATPYRAIPSYYDGKIKWVTSGELNYNVIHDTIEHISDLAMDRTSLTLHPINTFLMAITGLEAAGTRGRCAMLGVDATTNQSCMAIYGTNSLLVQYLFHFYCYFGVSLAFRYCQGTKQQSYTAKIVKKLPIVCPSKLDEQKAIAEALSDADSLIASLEKLIAKKKAIKQGAMQELLTGKKRLHGFRDEWIRKSVKELGEVITGGTPPTNDVALWYGDIPWVTPTDINSKRDIYETERQITKKGLEKLRSLPENSVLITCIASIGKNVILRKNGGCNQQINAIVPHDDICTEFIFYLMEINSDYLLQNAGITATNIISKKVFEELTFLLPKDKTEQTAIATILSDIDDEIEQLEKKLAKYRLIKQGMMQELLTGRIRLVNKK